MLNKKQQEDKEKELKQRHLKEQRYANYLALKEEFEGDNK